jgi:hypothetical protein
LLTACPEEFPKVARVTLPLYRLLVLAMVRELRRLAKMRVWSVIWCVIVTSMYLFCNCFFVWLYTDPYCLFSTPMEVCFFGNLVC